MNPENLLVGLYTNDDRAYEALYTCYYTPLVLFASKYVQDLDISEDLVQEVFVAMLSGKNRFDSLERLKMYLYAAVRNRALNYLRHQKYEELLQNDTLRDQETQLTLFEERMLEEDLFAQLLEAIDQLPGQCRKVIQLTLEGHKISEIAKQLDISLYTAKSYKKLACKKLTDRFRNTSLCLWINLLLA